MKTRHALYSSLITTFILTSISITASANVLVETATYSGADSFSDSLSFGGFNPSLGTLTGISITLDTTEVVSAGVINLTGASQGFANANASVPISVTALDSLSATVTGSAGPFAGTVNPFPPVDYIAGSADILTKTVQVSSADFSLYESGLYNLTVAADAGTYSGTQTTGYGGVYFGGTETATGSVVVDYTYTSVPDSSLPVWLTAGIFAGLCVVAKKARLQTV